MKNNNGHEKTSVSLSICTTKGGSCRLEKSHKVWMMMIAASLMWAGAAEPEQIGVKKLTKMIQNNLIGSE